MPLDEWGRAEYKEVCPPISPILSPGKWFWANLLCPFFCTFENFLAQIWSILPTLCTHLEILTKSIFSILYVFGTQHSLNLGMIHVQRQSIWREFYDFNVTIEFTKSLNLKLWFPSIFRIGKIWYSQNVVDLCMDYWLKLFTSLAIEVLPLFSCDETVLTSAETLLINKWWVWEKKKKMKTIEWEAWVLKNKGASPVCLH